MRELADMRKAIEQKAEKWQLAMQHNVEEKEQEICEKEWTIRRVQLEASSPSRFSNSRL